MIFSIQYIVSVYYKINYNYTIPLQILYAVLSYYSILSGPFLSLFNPFFSPETFEPSIKITNQVNCL